MLITKSYKIVGVIQISIILAVLNIKIVIMEAMTKLDYAKFMATKPTLLHSVVNQKDQKVDFYEPEKGDSSLIIGVIGSTAFETDFFDTDDFYEGSEYNPILLPDNLVVCAFDLSPADV